MNPYGVVVLTTLVVAFLLQLVARLLNVRAMSPELPAEFESLYAAAAYRRSQDYTRARSRFALYASAYDLLLLLAFWFAGGFGWLDVRVRELGLAPVPSGLLYIGTLVLLKGAADLPWSVYSTFVIEERFGFNRTTVRTFVADLLKGLLLAAFLGALLLTLLLFLFERAGSAAWLYCWAAVTVFTLLMQYVVPTWILPLFHRFTPLAEGALRDALLCYAERVGFPLAGVFVVDGSKRSSKSNAFFTGFGRRKRIALFDTLVEKHPVGELVAVLAHEVGHYRCRHLVKGLMLAILHGGLLLYLLQIFMTQRGLFAAFYVEQPSIYAAFVLFGLLYSPVELLLSLALNAMSRRFELAADRFAVETTGEPEAMSTALRRLSADNLSNLTPHPFYVALSYSHPPVLERIRAIERQAAERLVPAVTPPLPGAAG